MSRVLRIMKIIIRKRFTAGHHIEKKLKIGKIVFFNRIFLYNTITGCTIFEYN